MFVLVCMGILYLLTYRFAETGHRRSNLLTASHALHMQLGSYTYTYDLPVA